MRVDVCDYGTFANIYDKLRTCADSGDVVATSDGRRATPHASISQSSRVALIVCICDVKTQLALTTVAPRVHVSVRF